MKAKATALMLADLGVVKSHSRPHTPNDNPFSEAHFKTLKYQPEFPKRFETIDAARIFCRRFFAWYDEDHHQGGNTAIGTGKAQSHQVSMQLLHCGPLFARLACLRLQPDRKLPGQTDQVCARVPGTCQRL